MDYLTSFEISAAGMNFERLRADVASANLANMHTTRSLQGGPYKPLRAVAGAGAVPASFENHMSAAALEAGGPPSAEVREMPIPARMVYEPGHPDADEKGFVAYPNITLVSEMVNLMTATRSYEANVSAMNAAKAMALKALDIGGNR